MASSATQTYLNLQLLRGAAALLVVGHHISILLKERGLAKVNDWATGAAGVDIFFPISGFVMVASTHASWGRAGSNRDFIFKRFLRVAPLYWILTTLKLGLLLALPSLAVRGTLESWHTISSYLFLPGTNIADGHNHPILPMGWTLNLEMFFYVLFGCALLLSRNPLGWMIGLLFVIGLARPLGVPVPENLHFYADPIIFEFALGMFAGFLAVRGKLLPSAAAWWALAASLFVLGSVAHLPNFSSDWRLLAWGMPGALLVFALASLEGKLTGLPCFRFGLLLGDASYAIYLSHGFVLSAVGIFANRLGLSGAGTTIGVATLSLILSVVAGILVHRWLELPVGRFLRRHLLTEKMSVRPAPLSVPTTP